MGVLLVSRCVFLGHFGSEERLDTKAVTGFVLFEAFKMPRLSMTFPS